MSENKIKKLNDNEMEAASGGVSEKNKSDIKPLAFGKCYCGYEQDLSEVSAKKMFMNAGTKKEWKCPYCGRNNVERDFKWAGIFEFK